MEREENLIFDINKYNNLIDGHLRLSDLKEISIDYGQKVKKFDNRVIIAKDTRPNGEMLEKVIIEGLIFAGCEIINLGICPIPVLFYLKNKYNIFGSIYISASERSISYNKIKLIIGNNTAMKFLVKNISKNPSKIDLNYFNSHRNTNIQSVKHIDPFSVYTNDLLKNFDINKIKSSNNLRVIIDTGAGAGTLFTPKILEKLGCNVLVINDRFNKEGDFPRELRPTKQNLRDLILTLWKGNYDVGFAHDCDANKLTIISDNFECYSEDIGAAIILSYYLNHPKFKNTKFVFYLNLASSLRFEILAEQYDVQTFKTYISDYWIKDLKEKLLDKVNEFFVFGTEGICGGPIFPYFNNVKDGIFIASKVIEVLTDAKEKISVLYSKLPRYYSYREKINIGKNKIESLIKNLNEELTNEGEILTQVGMNLRFGQGKDWFVLIYPSLQSIQIISEAKSDSLARLYCETTVELIKMLLSRS